METNKARQTSQGSNHLLAALPKKEFERIARKMDPAELIFDTDVFKLDQKISHVYFPESGIISLLAAVDKKATTEVGIVGREGMVGLPVFLGVRISRIHAVVQGTGQAMRIRSEDFQTECALGGELNVILRRFANSMMVQISQSAVCFRFHLIEQRLARWLLMTADRMEAQTFGMTQEFLSNMLGVRREAVNRATRSLEKQGIVVNRRGVVEIVDRESLEGSACVCYSIVRQEELRVIASGNASGQ